MRGGDGAAAAVVAILGSLGLRALDSWTGEIFDPQRAAEGLHWRRAYRDRVVGA